jgi:hypothetical protein
MIYCNKPAFLPVKIMLEENYKINSDLYFGYNLPDKEHDSPFADMLRKSRSENKNIILYQLEQLVHGSYWLTDASISRLKYADCIWDYDIDNIDFIKTQLKITKNVFFRPMLFSNNVKIDLNQERDIDILFYGGISDRRKAVLTEIQRKLFNTKITFMHNVWGQELKDLISRSKIILNIHCFEYNRQEQVRIFPLVCSGCCVVSEYSDRNYFGDSIFNVPDSEIADMCNYLLSNNRWYDFSKNVQNTYMNISNHHKKNIIN